MSSPRVLRTVVTMPAACNTLAKAATRAFGERIVAFAKVLQDAGIVTTVRKTRGDDIDAACGQLAGEVQDRTRLNERLTRRPVRIPVRAAAADGAGR